VEHDPLEIKARVAEIAQGALAAAGVAPSELAAVGITNQRETTVVWDRATGRPVCNAIVWQDTRTAGICDELARDGGQTGCGRRLGCRWRPTSRARRYAGSWTTCPVSGLAPRPVRSSAARSTRGASGPDRGSTWRTPRHRRDQRQPHPPVDLETLQWDDEASQLDARPRAMLPDVRSSSEVYGTAVDCLPGVPIAGDLGTSRPRSSATPGSGRGMPRTRTGRAASHC